MSRRTLTDILSRYLELPTLGQYLQPTPNRLHFARWLHPDDFVRYHELAPHAGVRAAASGPFERLTCS